MQGFCLALHRRRTEVHRASSTANETTGLIQFWRGAFFEYKVFIYDLQHLFGAEFCSSGKPAVRYLINRKSKTCAQGIENRKLFESQTLFLPRNFFHPASPQNLPAIRSPLVEPRAPSHEIRTKCACTILLRPKKIKNFYSLSNIDLHFSPFPKTPDFRTFRASSCKV